MQQGYHVDIKDLFNQGEDGIGCLFTIDKSTIIAIRSAKSIGDGLQAFCLERDANDEKERLKKEEERRQEEEYRKQDEIDRKRRAKMKAEAREYRKREREKMRLKFEAEREIRRIEEKKAEMMDRVHASAEKENKRIIKDVLRDYVSKGYLSKEEAKEFMGEYGDEIIENPESILKKLEEYFGYKAEDYRREEQEKDDKESAEILGKTCN